MSSNHRSRYIGGSLIVIVVLALIIWMATGHIKKMGASGSQPAPAKASAAADKAGTDKASADAPPKPVLFQVSVAQQTAETIEREIKISGDTAPERVIRLSSQGEGLVQQWFVERGSRLQKGQRIAQLDVRDAPQQSLEAAAILKVAEMEYIASQKLRDAGHLTAAEVARKFAQWQSATSALKAVERRMEYAQITAPSAGIWEEQMLEVGSFVRVGDRVGTILVTDPLVISGTVQESDIATVKVGSRATVRILGQTLPGTVRFVSSQADPKTRTFTVEIRVANPGSTLPAGLSAEVMLGAGAVAAHKLPAALLSLSDDGVLGVKLVNTAGKVVFLPAQIAKADGDAVWLQGLPEQINVITRGQGFVKAGESVRSSPQTP